MRTVSKLTLNRVGLPVAKPPSYIEVEKTWEKFLGFLPDTGKSGAEIENLLRRNKRERVLKD